MIPIENISSTSLRPTSRLALLMTEKTSLLDSEADTSIALLPGPTVRHLPLDFQVAPNPAVRHKPALEADNESGRICHPRAFSRTAQEELRAGDAFEQKVWLILAVCSAVAILYAAFCFFMRH
jgi:hypothetical protein